MKPLHLPLFVVGMLAPFLLTAQSLHLIGSSPANQSANVALSTTVVFTFDHPIQPGIASLDSIGDRFIVIPQDKIVVNSLSLSSDSRSLIATVIHQPDVDYTWAFFGLRATNGAVMTDFHTVSYTTSATASPFSIVGQMTLPDPPPSLAFSGSVVMLMRDLSFMNENNDTGPQDDMLYATVPDPNTGVFAFPAVKPGSYFVMAMMFNSLGGNMEPQRIGFHQGPTGSPEPVTVTDASISGLVLRMQMQQSSGPVDATQAFGVIDAMMSVEHPLAEPIVMEGNSPEFPANGDSYEWMVFYYNDLDSMITMVASDGNRILGMESMHLLSMPENERPPVDLATIKSIPDNFVGSRAAYEVALQNGLGQQIYLDDHSAQWRDVHMMLSHLYFEYPDLVSLQSNPFWVIRYKVQYFNEGMEFAFLVDAVTGTFLGKIQIEDSWNQNSLELISSTPQAMSSQVPLQTRVSFTFNEPIQVETLNMNSLMQTWSVIPMDRITIHNVSFSEDYRTVFMDVTHSANTDYVWSFQGIRSTSGAGLNTAEIINYTTQATVSPLVLAGSLIWPDAEFIPQPNQATAIVVLLNSADYFTNGMQGPPTDAVNGGANLDGSWNYAVMNVRPGTYYPAVFVFGKGGDFGNNLIAYGYLPDAQNAPKSFTISDHSFTNFNIPVWLKPSEPEHHPIDLLQVYDTVKQHVAAQANGAELITAFGREEVFRPMMPTGTSFDWSFIYYESATDTVQMMQAGSDGIFAVDRFHVTNIPEEERIPKELVRPLPSTFIGSGQAMMIARTHGLDELIQSTPPEAWAQVRFGVSNFYFQYPDLLNSNSPPFWDIQYNAELWDNQNNLLWSREANFLIDAISGAFINKRVTTDLEDADAPHTLQLDQNYPNPFNPSTVIRFTLYAGRQTRLTVYDILGREVAVLVDGVMAAGSHSVVFDASALPSGVYLYRLVAGGETLQRKLTLVR